MDTILGLLVAVIIIGLIIGTVAFAVLFYGAGAYFAYKILIAVLTLTIKGVKHLYIKLFRKREPV
ncbi:MAG: hypothetical protein NZ530_06745 [Thermodesulfobacteriaceae bacterium]|nr:hypothetical protein [Thermodesulfobacteriaceae bacterium]MDW8136125.1 hypothetical protein [Thermodesulfobacterium sp.]